MYLGGRAKAVLDAGADWVKVYGSTGGGDDVTGDQTISFEEMKAIIDTAVKRRGFLAGVVRKKLDLTLQSEKADGEHTYRVIDNEAEASTSAQPQAA